MRRGQRGGGGGGMCAHGARASSECPRHAHANTAEWRCQHADTPKGPPGISQRRECAHAPRPPRAPRAGHAAAIPHAGTAAAAWVCAGGRRHGRLPGGRAVCDYGRAARDVAAAGKTEVKQHVFRRVVCVGQRAACGGRVTAAPGGRGRPGAWWALKVPLQAIVRAGTGLKHLLRRPQYTRPVFQNFPRNKKTKKRGLGVNNELTC